MSKTANRTDPKLWESVKTELTKSEKGGRAGEWSARKAQLAVQEYKKRGGGYEGSKSSDNALKQWTEEDWGTKSGRDSRETGERYLPEKARKALSDDEYKTTSAKKRADTRSGKQVSKQPNAIAEKTARYRDGGKAVSRRGEQTRDELMDQARYLDIDGRSRMLKSELENAIRLAKH
jgi:hypothetical protein